MATSSGRRGSIPASGVMLSVKASAADTNNSSRLAPVSVTPRSPEWSKNAYAIADLRGPAVTNPSSPRTASKKWAPARQNFAVGSNVETRDVPVPGRRLLAILKNYGR